VWLAVLDQALPANNVYGDLQSTLVNAFLNTPL
jgi:hypothetical protein